MKKETLYREYVENKLNQNEIAEKYNVAQQTISRLMKQYGIATRPKHSNIDETLTDMELQFIFGKLLGDGSVYMGPSSMNARLGFAHVDTQKEYIEYCYSFISRWCKSPPKYVEYNRNPKIYKNPVGKKYVLESISHPEFTRLRRYFYENGKKIVNMDILSNITPLGLAIWYQDDGSAETCSRSKRINGLRLHTNQFPKQSVELIVKWLKDTYNINSTINKTQMGKDGIAQYSIRISKSSIIDFCNIIKPYVVNSMKYKLVDDIVRSL